MTELHEPALFAYVFAPIDGGELASVHRAWAAVAALGMTEPVAGMGVSTALGNLPVEPVPQFRVLAAGTRGGDTGQYQAYAFAYHDVAGIVVCLAPAEGTSAGWEPLLDEWVSAFDDPGGLLGTAVVMVGLIPGRVDSSEPPPIDGRPWVSGFRTDRGIVVWESSGEPRLLALLGPPEREVEIDRWAWWIGETRLPSLALYLLHAAKLRFEAGVYQSQIGDFHRAQRELDDDVVTLMGVLAGEDRRPLTTDRLYEAQRRLLATEGRLAGMIGSLTSLEDMRRTVTIARNNMSALVPPPARGESGETSPFADDIALADWLDAQVAHDIGYATSTRERTDRVRDLLSLRLSHATERQMQEQNYLLLLQTALVSALIAGVTVFATLRHNNGTVKGSQLPWIAVGMALALALPLLFVHWYARYRWFDRIAAGLLGASLGWLAATAISSNPGGAPPLLAIPSALLVGGVAMALTRLQDRRVARD